MAEITEVFEDVGQNVKKTFKNKKFLVAVAVVAVVALVVGFMRNRKEAEAEDATGYSAIGYAGYPTVGGSSEAGNYYESYDSTTDDFLAEFLGEYNNSMTEMQTNIDMLTERQITAEETIANQKTQIDRQNALSQMKANSELYNTLTGSQYADQREALHNENLKIAESIGLTYDEKSGNYFDGESVAYTTSQQQANIITGKNQAGSGSGNTNFQSNRDYQAEINKAILSGADSKTIDSLNAQRNAKIASSGGSVANANKGYDPNTDYSALIQKAQASGASQDVINNLNEQRNAKIADMNK